MFFITFCFLHRYIPAFYLVNNLGFLPERRTLPPSLHSVRVLSCCLRLIYLLENSLYMFLETYINLTYIYTYKLNFLPLNFLTLDCSVQVGSCSSSPKVHSFLLNFTPFSSIFWTKTALGESSQGNQKVKGDTGQGR